MWSTITHKQRLHAAMQDLSLWILTAGFIASSTSDLINHAAQLRYYPVSSSLNVLEIHMHVYYSVYMYFNVNVYM